MQIKAIAWFLVGVLWFLSGCKPTIQAEYHLLYQSPEVSSFQQADARLCCFPILTNETTDDQSTTCLDAEPLEHYIKGNISKIKLYPFQTFCTEIIREPERYTELGVVKNRYFRDGQLDRERIQQFSQGGEATHWLLLRIDKKEQWKDNQGKTNKKLIIKGSLVDLAETKSVMEFLCAVGSSEGASTQETSFQDLAAAAAMECLNRLPQEQARVIQERSKPDF